MKENNNKYFEQLSQKILDNVSQYEYRKKQRKQIVVNVGIPVIIILFILGGMWIKSYESVKSNNSNMLYAQIENYLAETTSEYELYYDLQENPDQELTVNKNDIVDYLVDDTDSDYELFQNN